MTKAILKQGWLTPTCCRSLCTKGFNAAAAAAATASPSGPALTIVVLGPFACVLKHSDTAEQWKQTRKWWSQHASLFPLQLHCSLTVHVTHVTELSECWTRKAEAAFEVDIWSGDAWQNTNNPQREQGDESVGTQRGKVRFWQSLSCTKYFF